MIFNEPKRSVASSSVFVDRIDVVAPPIKRRYKPGELFNPRGMEILATYSNGTSGLVRGYTYSPDGPLTPGTSVVTIRYAEGGKSVSTQLEITVLDGVEVGKLDVGSTIQLNVNGKPRDFIVVHQGKPSDLYDDSCDGTWLLMADCYRGSQWDSSRYISSYGGAVHRFLNNDFFGLLDENIRSAIKFVKIPYGYAGSSGAVYTGSDGISAKIFLLSVYEAGGLVYQPTIKTKMPEDGTVLKYFEDASTVRERQKATINGTASNWWLRSLESTYGRETSDSGGIITYRYVACVYTSGGVTDCAADTVQGVRPAFILPSDYMIGDVIGETIDASPDMVQKIAKDKDGPNYFSVGDKIPITLNGTVGSLAFEGETYYAFIIGFDHNEDVEGPGIHFQFGKLEDNTDIAFVDSGYNKTYSANANARFAMNDTNTNIGGWEGSYMRQTICREFFTALPEEWQNTITECIKYTDNVGGSNTASNVTSTEDKIWLLAEWEIYGVRSSANSAEKNFQQQYAYYANGNSRIKYRHNSIDTACSWWTRSTGSGGAVNYRNVNISGNIASSTAYYSLGFSPVFKVG